jgi:hypothetical protein
MTSSRSESDPALRALEALRQLDVEPLPDTETGPEFGGLSDAEYERLDAASHAPGLRDGPMTTDPALRAHLETKRGKPHSNGLLWVSDPDGEFVQWSDIDAILKAITKTNPPDGGARRVSSDLLVRSEGPRLAAEAAPLDVETVMEWLHDLDGTQHYITHETSYDGDDMEGVECMTGVEGHRDDAKQLLAALRSPDTETAGEAG